MYVMNHICCVSLRVCHGLPGLENDLYVRQTDGYLPTAEVAFVDEIFKVWGVCACVGVCVAWICVVWGV